MGYDVESPEFGEDELEGEGPQFSLLDVESSDLSKKDENMKY